MTRRQLLLVIGYHILRVKVDCFDVKSIGRLILTSTGTSRSIMNINTFRDQVHFIPNKVNGFVTDFRATAYINSSHGASTFDILQTSFSPNFLTMIINRITLRKELADWTNQYTQPTLLTQYHPQTSFCETPGQLRSFQKERFNRVAYLLLRQRIHDCTVR